jgi:NDP-sugar pyrophosphorylase family protein
LLEQCKSNGITEFVFLCGYKSKIIYKYFGDVKKFGVKIKYHYNSVLVETYKRICDEKKIVQNNFLLLYADNYSSLNSHDLYKDYVNFKSKFIISICKKKM